ncbi:MAG: VOC family protein [Euzebyaceae bacterium]|nr:VOC family protein [Euzebyaceae bacterium]
MAERAFPVIFAGQVTATAEFYERLGFQRQYQLPPDGDPGYVGLRRGAAELAVVAADWPQQQYGAAVAAGVRFKIFIYVGDVDSAVEELRQRRGTILRDAMDMPWGERVAYVADPDGNPVALAVPANSDRP